MNEKQMKAAIQAIGRMGGNRTKARIAAGELPTDYYSQIGKKSGNRRNAMIANGELPKDFYGQIGRKGGVAKAATHGDDE